MKVPYCTYLSFELTGIWFGVGDSVLNFCLSSSRLHPEPSGASRIRICPQQLWWCARKSFRTEVPQDDGVVRDFQLEPLSLWAVPSAPTRLPGWVDTIR